MTLWANRDGQKITINGNLHLAAQITESQVTQFAFSEDKAHLRHFHGQLGKLLDEAEAEASDSA